MTRSSMCMRSTLLGAALGVGGFKLLRALARAVVCTRTIIGLDREVAFDAAGGVVAVTALGAIDVALMASAAVAATVVVAVFLALVVCADDDADASRADADVAVDAGPDAARTADAVDAAVDMVADTVAVAADDDDTSDDDADVLVVRALVVTLVVVVPLLADVVGARARCSLRLSDTSPPSSLVNVLIDDVVALDTLAGGGGSATTASADVTNVDGVLSVALEDDVDKSLPTGCADNGRSS
jgi:hypothetical protein